MTKHLLHHRYTKAFAEFFAGIGLMRMVIQAVLKTIMGVR
jgi:hypothetical protein